MDASPRDRVGGRIALQSPEVQPFAPVANPMQELAGVGDYDGDGRPDLVWRHLETGALQVWLKGNPKARLKVTAPVDVAWRPAS